MTATRQICDVDLIDLLAVAEARESFWAYRRLMHPKMKIGWWQRAMARELQGFYDRLLAGDRPKMIITAPPQHGKSLMVVDFITWAAGKNPALKTIFASFSERLGIRANLWCQRIFSSPRYQSIFPETRIGDIRSGTGAARNREMLEYVDAEGYFRNTTVQGAITGEGLDLGVIDDAIKGRSEANSQSARDKTWDWFTDDFFTRFSDDAGFVMVLTRWHVDDIAGRAIQTFGSDIRVVSYPAIAVCDERHRAAGEPLFPEHKSLAFLLEHKSTMSAVNWEAVYQQNPQIIGGEIINGKHFGRYTQLPIIKYRCIYADTAQKTAERNDYSVFQCWGKADDGKIYLIDQIRGKWEAPELERRAIAFWSKHKPLDFTLYGQLRQMKIEDKASGTGLIQGLKLRPPFIPVHGIERNRDKYTRLTDVLGYIEAGYVMIPENADFTNDFVAECEAFSADDSHQYDDQVDPMIDAINDMLYSGNAVALWERAG